MAVVDYSDSESDDETVSIPPAQPSKGQLAAKPAFQKAAPGKIKVDLPSIKPEPGRAENANPDGPPAKRARTSGAFSGINNFLPAPKRAALKKGISLKTSSEPAFSRNPLPPPAETFDDSTTLNDNKDTVVDGQEQNLVLEEPKLVGKATRFLPLSVANKKKKRSINRPSPMPVRSGSTASGKHSTLAKSVTEKVAKDAEAIPTPKRALFSMQQDEDALPVQSSPGQYEPLIATEGRVYLPEEIEQSAEPQAPNPVPTNPNSLEATADELNLTPAQRRQLFGRKGKDANVTQFNLESEYASNEQMRQAGEVVEHRTVKSIAPGKHSLQQLVNNARTQQDAMEDKWAEGRRNQGGSQYGWRA